MTVQFSTAPNVCFCTTWGNKTNEIKHFYPISPVRVFPGCAEADIWWGGTRSASWWQVVSKMFASNILKICQSFFKSQSIILRMFFVYFCSFPTQILLVLFSQVMQKQTMGEEEYWMVIWWPAVPKTTVPKIIKIGYPFFKWQSITFGTFFQTQCITLKHHVAIRNINKKNEHYIIFSRIKTSKKQYYHGE